MSELNNRQQQQQQQKHQQQQQQQQQQQRIGGYKVKNRTNRKKNGASQNPNHTVIKSRNLAAILAGGRASSAEVQDLMFQLS
jgi:hypothetical protein